jgi:hypothetical protein
MVAEAGGDGVEVGIVVAGVTEELEGAGGGKGGEGGLEGVGVEAAGGGDAEGAVGGEGTVGGTHVGGAEAVEESNLEATFEGGAGGILREGRFEGIAEGGELGASEDRAELGDDCREEVGVFVSVEVGGTDAGALEFLELSESFTPNLVGVDAVEQEIADEVEERRAEGATVGAERGERAGVGDRGAVGEDDVAADAERGGGAGDGDGVVEGGAVGHEGGGGEGSGGVEFGDGAVDAGGEAEVVSVEDEAGGHRIDCSGEGPWNDCWCLFGKLHKGGNESLAGLIICTYSLCYIEVVFPTFCTDVKLGAIQLQCRGVDLTTRY